MRGIIAIANIMQIEGTEFLFCYPGNALIEAAAIAGIKSCPGRSGQR
jgi:hypothetical protein